MVMLLSQFPEQYDARIQTQIFSVLDEAPAIWKNYFNVKSTTKYDERTTGYSTFGIMPTWKDRENLPLDSAVKLYDSVITQITYGLGFKISRDMVDFGHLNIAESWADGLGLSVAELYSVTHANVLNNAFTTTYSSLGDVALISASHTAGGGQTRSNIIASTALTSASLAAMRVIGANLTDYRGKHTPIIYTKIIVPPALEEIAIQLNQSANKVGSMDNDINVHRGRYTVIVDPYLDASSTAWFAQAQRHGLKSYHAKTPTPKKYYDDSSESVVHGVKASFGVGVDYFEGIAGSQGA